MQRLSTPARLPVLSLIPPNLMPVANAAEARSRPEQSDSSATFATAARLGLPEFNLQSGWPFRPAAQRTAVLRDAEALAAELATRLGLAASKSGGDAPTTSAGPTPRYFAKISIPHEDEPTSVTRSDRGLGLKPERAITPSRDRRDQDDTWTNTQHRQGPVARRLDVPVSSEMSTHTLARSDPSLLLRRAFSTGSGELGLRATRLPATSPANSIVDFH